jgi:DNA polymerase type B, organellar and viral
MIKIQTYPIKNLAITNELLVIYIENFWSEIFKSIKDTKHLLILCKVQFSENEMGYRTIGHLRKVNFEDKSLYLDYLLQNLSILNDSYVVQPISKITFSYVIKDGSCTDKDRALLTDLNDKVSTNHSFNNMNLPISMNPSDYGDIELDGYIQENGQSYHRFMVKNGNKTFRIDISSDRSQNTVTILGNINLSWVDTKIDDTISDIFKREIKKSTIYFMDGEAVVRKQVLPAKPFRRTKVDSSILNDFLTMDIETISQDGKLIPYLITAYNGIDYITSYGKDQKEIFNIFFDQLLSMIKDGVTKVYAHNLSGFDGIFLMKHLLSFGEVTPLLFNGKLLSIKVKIVCKNKTKTIIFKDSFLLLPLSLRKLCVAFNVETPKGYFPFKLTNIFYSGIIPKFTEWTGITLSEYDSLLSNYKGKMWNFQQESIKYCKLDCLTLHQILTKFNELIFNEFKINIHSVLTLPALAMKIYKTHYMPENTVYQILGNAEQNIRQSYTGGAVDVYIPHNRVNSFIVSVKGLFIDLFYYDVNSLYPFVMAKHLMPIGKPLAFEGNIRRVEPNAFGFFNCKITSPVDLKHPLLQCPEGRRIKTEQGMRTIAGLGSWTGWICSNEMDNAIKFGYQFEILNGYQFETGNIFKEYIFKMYNLRQEYDKSHAMNLIAKLLMNSLYGKFGMKLESTEIVMYDTSTEEGNSNLHKDIKINGEAIQDYINIDKIFYLIIRKSSIPLHHDKELDMYHGQDINIAIASAITAGARVHMSIFKNNPDFNLYYSDTDSAVIDKALPIDMVGNKLGQVKLEHNINRAVFLAPKVYGLVDKDGNEIIKVKGVTQEEISKLTLKSLKEELENLKKPKSSLKVTPSTTKRILTENSNNSEVAGHDIKGSYINRIYMKSSMFWLYIITGVLAYAHKIPYIGRLITLVSFWYGRTTWWKLLVKIRKMFIMLNALIGVMIVFKTTGFSSDNILAGFTGMGYTYLEIVFNFTKRLFNWFVELFDHKVVPNVPSNPTNPSWKWWGPKENTWYTKPLIDTPSKLIEVAKNQDFFKSPFNINISMPTPWYKDWTNYLLIIGVLGVAYLGYKFIVDPLFIDSLPNKGKGIDPSGSGTPSPDTPTQASISNIPYINKMFSPITYIGGGIMKGFKMLNPLYWIPSSTDTAVASETFMHQQCSQTYDNRFYPFTEVHPYNSWYTKLRLSILGETNFEQSVRMHAKREILNGLIPSISESPRIIQSVPVSPYIGQVGLGFGVNSGDAAEASSSFFRTATKIASLPNTPKLTPLNILPEIVEGLNSWRGG